MEVGARTRSRAAMADASSHAAKRRKAGEEFVKLSSSTKAVSLVDSTAEEDRCDSSDREAQVSCCSSDGLSELDEEEHERIDEDDDRVSDLEVDESTEVETSTYNSRRERREMTPSSDLQESTTEANSTAEKMPSEFELEEFFASAEKDIQTRFAQKYNYDIATDTPMEGRFEWVRLKP